MALHRNISSLYHLTIVLSYNSTSKKKYKILHKKHSDENLKTAIVTLNYEINKHKTKYTNLKIKQ